MKDLMKLSDNQLKKKLLKMHPYDISKIIKDASDDAKMRIIHLLTLSKMIDVFIELPKDIARPYFNLLTENQKKQFLSGFEMDELKTFVTSFDSDMQSYLLSLMSERKQVILKRLMSYDETSIASIMTTDFITIDEALGIKEATSYVISTVKDTDFVDDLFVVNQKVLVGSVLLKDLISARPNDKLSDITYKTEKTLTIKDSIYQGFEKFRHYGKHVLPVVDEQEAIIGIVTADDILAEMVLENEENIEKMAALGDFDETSSAPKRAIQRLPWLLVSVVLNLVIAFALSIFEATLDQVIALILFQPMILGMAGNIGTQSIAVTILKINQYELEHQHKVNKHILKEIGIGVINSFFTGILGFFVALVVLALISVGTQPPLSIAFVIGLSLFGGMIISAMAGVLIPLLLDKFKVDPAVASGPIISTVNDLFALLVYFGIATLMFML